MTRGRPRLAAALPATLALFITSCLTPPAAADDAADRRRAEFFETNIRPVLVERCYECHAGADAKGGLSLDRAVGLTTGGDSGPAVESGKPDDSVLIQALRYDGSEMPPTGRLPDAVVADFETWVRDGAFDPRAGDDGEEVAASPAEPIDVGDHWAFRPPTRHEPPAVADAAWPGGPIDRFVLAKLDERGLSPSPEADRATLLRRLSFDLTGLPPTPEEVADFEADPRPDAWARRVDARLASPRFGETWGRHWLDVARYADTNGGDFNATLFDAWRYRQYVLAAFDADKPFDVFVREQLAGDLVPAADDAQRRERLAATGFLALGVKMLSERDKQKLTLDVADEQIDTIGKAFLGLTLGCARCHDHKFDPIPTRDYYALAGVFTSTVTFQGEIQEYVSDVVVRDLPPTPAEAAALAAHAARLEELDRKLATAKQDAAAAAAAQTVADLGTPGTVVVDDTDAAFVGEWTVSAYTPGFVGVGYRHDGDAGKGERSAAFAAVPPPGRYDVQLAYSPGANRAAAVPVALRHAEGVADLTVDQTKTAPIERRYLSLGVFRIDDAGGTVTLSNAGTAGHVIADAVRFVPAETVETAASGAEVAAAQERVAAAKTALAAAEKERKAAAEAAPRPPRALSVAEAKTAADCRIRIRGEPGRPGDVVPRGVLSCCSDGPVAFPSDQSGRLELARWIASPEHPLTARVYVNRVWMRLFGEGIVRTVDAFGLTGEPPTHPELLDDLAVRFAADGWSTKRLVREIVLSRAYRQASGNAEFEVRNAVWREGTPHSELADPHFLDPENRLLWRMNRKPLTAEALRDSLLTLSGSLDDARPTVPVAGFGRLAVDNTSGQANDGGLAGERAVRSVYLPLVRNDLPAVLTVFDFADPEAVVGKRDETNVPTQALFLLNSPFVRDAAAATAARVSGQSADDGAGVDRLYRLALSRPPSLEELDRARTFLHAGPRERRWPLFVQALFASTGFRSVE